MTGGKACVVPVLGHGWSTHLARADAGHPGDAASIAVVTNAPTLDNGTVLSAA